MWVSQWEILLVDDEPDVLSVSKLAMRNFEVYGLPLVIHTAESKAEALEWLNNRPERHAPIPVSRLAVAFIDVVMETDSAGLELCDAIREEMGNRLTQLFIRTGQPGIAPEREVIDRYDINGYFTKTEATEDKLYSLVKSGVRQYYWSFLSQLAVPFLNSTIAASGSWEEIVERFGQVMAWARMDRRSESQLYYSVDDVTLFLEGWDEKTAQAAVKRFQQMEGTALSDEGDLYAVDDEGHVFIKVAPRPDRAEVNAVISTKFAPPTDIVRIVHNVFVGLGIAWQKSS